jgi:hypothetical protein
MRGKTIRFPVGDVEFSISNSKEFVKEKICHAFSIPSSARGEGIV